MLCSRREVHVSYRAFIIGGQQSTGREENGMESWYYGTFPDFIRRRDHAFLRMAAPAWKSREREQASSRKLLPRGDGESPFLSGSSGCPTQLSSRNTYSIAEDWAEMPERQQNNRKGNQEGNQKWWARAFFWTVSITIARKNTPKNM